jgi:hypothetical protein
MAGGVAEAPSFNIDRLNIMTFLRVLGARFQCKMLANDEMATIESVSIAYHRHQTVLYRDQKDHTMDYDLPALTPL